MSNMNLSALILVCFVVLGVFVCCEEKYTDKYDNVNLDEILNNERLFQNYANCILEKGKCTPEGEEIKNHIKEALETECAKCNEKHREGIKKVIVFLAKEKPDVWKEVQEKYDPEGKYKEKYSDLVKV